MWVQILLIGVRSDRAMGTMGKKEEFIKVRVTKEQKELFKQAAKLKGVTMTELLVVGTEERALKEVEKVLKKDQLEKRVDDLENKIQDLKRKMDSKDMKKKSFFKNFSK